MQKFRTLGKVILGEKKTMEEERVLTVLIVGLFTYTSSGQSFIGYSLYICILAKQDRREKN